MGGGGKLNWLAMHPCAAYVEGNQSSGLVCLHFMFRFESMCQFCVLKIHTHTHTQAQSGV